MKLQDNFGVTADAARAFVPSASSPTVSPVPASIPNAELLEIATGFREGILQGGSSFMMCAAVSWPLAAYLRAMHGVECETVESDFGECNHFWIKLADGRALDPTLDQFNRWFPWKNYPPVYLGELAEYERMVGLDAWSEPAQGTEAGTAETGTGSVHDGPVVEDHAPQGASHD